MRADQCTLAHVKAWLPGSNETADIEGEPAEDGPEIYAW